MAFEKIMQDFARRREHALEMGGAAKAAQHHSRGKWTSRERITRLLDPESFLEVGRFNHSDIPGMAKKTPADSKIWGYGAINGRQVVMMANDFTVLAATSSRVAGRKEGNVILMRKRCGRKIVDRQHVFEMQTVYRIFDKESNRMVY